MLADKIRHFLRKTTCIIDRTRRHLLRKKNAVLNGNAVVVLTKGRCLMDNASAVGIRYVGVGEHTECPVLELSQI